MSGAGEPVRPRLCANAVFLVWSLTSGLRRVKDSGHPILETPHGNSLQEFVSRARLASGSAAYTGA